SVRPSGETSTSIQVPSRVSKRTVFARPWVASTSQDAALASSPSRHRPRASASGASARSCPARSSASCSSSTLSRRSGSGASPCSRGAGAGAGGGSWASTAAGASAQARARDSTVRVMGVVRRVAGQPRTIAARPPRRAGQKSRRLKSACARAYRQPVSPAATASPMTTATAQTRKFEAEVDQVLHLVTHSLYSHKEIFLRELVSNASDACDKLRFEAIARPELLEGAGALQIDVSVDREARTITIRDTGIGMSRDEVVANIGSIASSGTRRFLEALAGEQKADARLIGQFGVGFYSAFVVADRVTVLTRRAGAAPAEGVKWESDGRGEYTLEPVELAERGTTVVLHLKADEDRKSVV